MNTLLHTSFWCACRKCAPGEEVDTDDSLQDVGEEWPDFEETGLARQREFYQVHTYMGL